MARAKTEELQKHTLNLRAGDMDALDELFPRVPASVMVRRVISKFVDKIRHVPETDTDIPDIEL
jgi:hypothetical protein